MSTDDEKEEEDDEEVGDLTLNLPIQRFGTEERVEVKEDDVEEVKEVEEDEEEVEEEEEGEEEKKKDEMSASWSVSKRFLKKVHWSSKQTFIAS